MHKKRKKWKSDGGLPVLKTLHSPNLTYVFSPLSGLRGPNVWLVGHSYLYSAAHQASSRPGGGSLLEKHLGFTGLPEGVVIIKLGPDPTFLVIHAGDNDMCSVRLTEFSFLAFSELVIVWSEIVPRMVRNGGSNYTAIERARWI